jgi:hypothetical protein
VGIPLQGPRRQADHAAGGQYQECGERPWGSVGTAGTPVASVGLALHTVHPLLAADDLRDPLVAHAHDAGDGLHRQAVAVCRADGLVALLAQLVAGLL